MGAGFPDGETQRREVHDGNRLHPMDDPAGGEMIEWMLDAITRAALFLLIFISIPAFIFLTIFDAKRPTFSLKKDDWVCTKSHWVRTKSHKEVCDQWTRRGK